MLRLGRGSKALAATAAALLLCAHSPPSTAEPVVVDGVLRPHRAETSSRFHCGDVIVELGFREESRSPHAVPRLSDALQVTLLHFRVSDRTMPSASRSRAEALLATFAWVDDVQVRCFAGRVQISFIAMSKREWIDFIEERISERPSARTRRIEVARDGMITIDGAAF